MWLTARNGQKTDRVGVKTDRVAAKAEIAAAAADAAVVQAQDAATKAETTAAAVGEVHTVARTIESQTNGQLSRLVNENLRLTLVNEGLQHTVVTLSGLLAVKPVATVIELPARKIRRTDTRAPGRPGGARRGRGVLKWPGRLARLTYVGRSGLGSTVRASESPGRKTAVIRSSSERVAKTMVTKRRPQPRAPKKERATMEHQEHPKAPVKYAPHHDTPGPSVPAHTTADDERGTAAAVASRTVVESLYGGGDFYLEIDSIEEFAAFVGLVLERKLDPRSVADFAAAKLERRAPARPVPVGGFVLVFTALHDFAAFLGILRGQILDVSSLAEVNGLLATARARLAASLDREGGTRRSPAAGPAPALPLSPRQPSEPIGDRPLMADQDPQVTIDNMVNEAAADVTVMGSASVVIDGFGQLLADAIAKATAGSATAAQLAPFVTIQTTLQTQSRSARGLDRGRTPAEPEVPVTGASQGAAQREEVGRSTGEPANHVYRLAGSIRIIVAFVFVGLATSTTTAFQPFVAIVDE